MIELTKPKIKQYQKKFETSTHQGLRLMQWDQCKLNGNTLH
jgi:hypothetical protein